MASATFTEVFYPFLPSPLTLAQDFILTDYDSPDDTTDDLTLTVTQALDVGNEGLVLDVSGTNVSVTLSLADPDGLLLQYEVTGARTLSEYQQVGGWSLWVGY